MLSLSSQTVEAQVVGAQWNSLTSGTLGGIAFSSSFCCGNAPFQSLTPFAFQGANFGSAPLAQAPVPQYGSNQTISIQFATPIDNLLLYAGFWRGAYTSPGPDPATTYTFSQGFSILSGFVGVAPIGNSLTLPGTQFFNGVIAFTGPVSQFTITSNYGGSGQVMTLATNTTVPEPSAYALVFAGLLVMGVVSRNRRLA